MVARFQKRVNANVKVLRLGKSRRLVRDDLVDHVHCVGLCCFEHLNGKKERKTEKKRKTTSLTQVLEKKSKEQMHFVRFFYSVIESL